MAALCSLACLLPVAPNGASAADTPAFAADSAADTPVSAEGAVSADGASAADAAVSEDAAGGSAWSWGDLGNVVPSMGHLASGARELVDDVTSAGASIRSSATEYAADTAQRATKAAARSKGYAKEASVSGKDYVKRGASRGTEYLKSAARGSTEYLKEAAASTMEYAESGASMAANATKSAFTSADVICRVIFGVRLAEAATLIRMGAYPLFVVVSFAVSLYWGLGMGPAILLNLSIVVAGVGRTMHVLWVVCKVIVPLAYKHSAAFVVLVALIFFMPYRMAPLGWRFRGFEPVKEAASSLSKKRRCSTELRDLTQKITDHAAELQNLARQLNSLRAELDGGVPAPNVKQQDKKNK